MANNEQFARSLRKQEGSNWQNRLRENMNQRARSIGEQMAEVFRSLQLTPQMELAAQYTSYANFFGPTASSEANALADLALQGNTNPDANSLISTLLSRPEFNRRYRGRVEVNPQMLLVFVIIIIMMKLMGCAPMPQEESTLTLEPMASDTLSAPSAPATEAIATEVAATEMAPTENPTETLEPTPSHTPEPTEIVVPPYLDDFIERGFNEQVVSDNGMHYVLREGDIKFAPGAGINYKGRIILSWIPATYMDSATGKVVEGNILAKTCQKNGSTYYVYDTVSYSISSLNECPTVDFARGQARDIAKLTVGDAPIIKGVGAWNTEGVLDFLPSPTGGPPKTINIPGIGEVFAVQHYELVDGFTQ